ncbi:MAG: NAD-dependent epimerase [Candidatus Stygibacter australis]|nr:NAD-dependent epimerase [Candidatus Stygibacter australis]
MSIHDSQLTSHDTDSVSRLTSHVSRILITGSAGFIGYHLVKRLVEDHQYEVIGLDNINDYYDLRVKYGRLDDCGIRMQNIKHNVLIESDKYPNYRFIKLDLYDQKNLDKLFENQQIDVVVNLAAQAGVRYSITNPDAYLKSNIIGFYNILEACRQHQIKHLVFASSSSVYGWNEKLPFSTSDNVDHPISLYAASKKSNELLAHSYSALYNIPTTGLRFFTVYGPWGRPDMALFLFTKKILADVPIDVYNKGEMIRDFTYIDDIIEGVVRVIQKPAQSDKEWSGKNPDPGSSRAPYKIYNIGNNSPVKLMDFIKAIEQELGKNAKMNLMPMQAGDVPASQADVSDLVRDFGYQPGTSVEVGIRQFVKWYLDFYGSNSQG